MCNAVRVRVVFACSEDDDGDTCGMCVQVGTIQAITREQTGSRASQWARQQSLIPGIIYGYDEEGKDTVDLVYVREADLRTEVNKRGACFTNTLFDMYVRCFSRTLTYLTPWFCALMLNDALPFHAHCVACACTCAVR